MKTYLNSEERRINTMIMIMRAIITTIIEREDIISKNESKYLKCIRTYIDKYTDALIERVGDKEQNRLYNEVMNNRIELRSRIHDKQILVNKDDLEEVCRMAVEANCFGCEKVGWHNCGLFKCMHNMDMGKVDEDHDGCEFYYEPIKEEK